VGDGDTASNALIALGAVTERVPKILANLQAGLKLGPNAEITSTLLAADRKPEIVHKSQIRAGIVAGAGTLGLSLLMIGLFDGPLAARRSKNAVHGTVCLVRGRPAAHLPPSVPHGCARTAVG
jgi:hypothetical protein